MDECYFCGSKEHLWYHYVSLPPIGWIGVKLCRKCAELLHDGDAFWRKYEEVLARKKKG